MLGGVSWLNLTVSTLTGRDEEQDELVGTVFSLGAETQILVITGTGRLTVPQKATFAPPVRMQTPLLFRSDTRD